MIVSLPYHTQSTSHVVRAGESNDFGAHVGDAALSLNVVNHALQLSRIQKWARWLLK